MRLIDADALGIGYANPLVFDKIEYAHGWNSAIEFIEKAPTIEAEPVKHGRWIEGKSLEKCSVCGKKGFPNWHYCPNCGAKMDG